MTRILISFLPDGELVLATAVRENALISSGGLGRDQSERQAAEQALRSLFNREADAAVAKAERERVVDPDALADHLPAPVPVDERPKGVPTPWGPVFENPVAIEARLQAMTQADAPSQKLGWIRYTDANGNTTERYIRVLTVGPGDGVSLPSSVDYVRAVDLEIGEPRSFKLDRIEACSAARYL